MKLFLGLLIIVAAPSLSAMNRQEAVQVLTQECIDHGIQAFADLGDKVKKDIEIEKLRKNAKTAIIIQLNPDQKRLAQELINEYFQKLKQDKEHKESSQALERFAIAARNLVALVMAQQ